MANLYSLIIQFVERWNFANLRCHRKTQIAIEYCYQFKEKHPDAQIFWQHVSTIGRAVSGWFDMARKLEIPGCEQPDIDIFRAVSKYLEDETQGQWLLLLDNADDGNVFFKTPPDFQSQMHQSSMNLEDCLPPNKQGTIVITTRDKRVGESLAFNKGVITVPALVEEKAMQLLRSKLPDHRWDPIQAEKLLVELECLPLAITQAAAYISQEFSSISEYLDFLQCCEDRKELLGMGFYDRRRDQDIQVPILRTWQLSFQLIQQQRPGAIQVLSTMAVIDREGIPESLFIHHGESKRPLRSDLAILQGFSLITAEKHDTTFRVHRLVQISVQAWLEQEGKSEDSHCEALNLLARAFPDGSFQSWTQCRILEPHVHAVSRYNFTSQQSRTQLSRLLCSLAVYEKEQGRYEDSYQRLLKAIAIASNALGSNDPVVADISVELGLTQERQGKYADAERTFNHAWKTLSKSYGPKHAKTLQSLNYIGGSLCWQGKYELATKTQQECWDLRRESLGDEHPNTIQSLSDLAACHEQLADFMTAENLHREAVAISNRTRGERNPGSMECLSRLGCALDKSGKHAEAEEIHRQAWELRRSTLGHEHPDAVQSRKYIAGSLWYQGNFSEAGKIHREVLRSRIYTLRERHPDTITSMKDLAFILDCQGEHVKSEKLHRDVLEARTKSLGKEHPDTLQSMCDLAYSLRRQGKLLECEKLLLVVYAVRLKTLGQQHPQTMESMDRIAGTLRAQKKIPAAIEMQHKVLEARKRALGPKHPETLASMDNVIGTLWGEQRLAEATDILTEALALRTEKYGEEDLETLIRMTRLAYLIRIQGNKDEAIEIYQKAGDIYKKTLGPDHPTTKECADCVTDTFAEKAADLTVEEPKAGENG